MLKPPTPINELERLKTLLNYQVLDTPSEAPFDAVTDMVADLLGVPIALVSLIDGGRQWFKSRHGLSATHTGREISFCGHGICQKAPFVVENAGTDPRFHDNPLVTGDPRVVFYAGAPLIAPNGTAIGMLCAIDHKARQLTELESRLLTKLASHVIQLLEDRRARMELQFKFSELQGLVKQTEEARVLVTEMAKMAALGQMARALAHDSNNALAIIQGSAQRLSSELKARGLLQGSLSTAAQAIGDSVRRISLSIQGMQRFNASGAIDDTCWFLLAEAIQAASTHVQPRYQKKQIRLKFELDGLAKVSARPQVLQQAFTSLFWFISDNVASGSNTEVEVRQVAGDNRGLQLEILFSGTAYAPQNAAHLNFTVAQTLFRTAGAELITEGLEKGRMTVTMVGETGVEPVTYGV